MNLFASPLNPTNFWRHDGDEHLEGHRACRFVMARLRLAVLSYNVLVIGLWLMPFVLNLVVTGWIIGVFTTSLIMRFGQEAEVLAWSMVFLFQPISCVFYPLEVLPMWLQADCLVNPAAHIFEGMRAVLNGTGAPLAHLAWAGVTQRRLVDRRRPLFYRTFAYCKVQGSLVRVGE